MNTRRQLQRCALCVVWLSTIAAAETAKGEKPVKKAGAVRTDNGLGMALAWCSPGSFRMGISKAQAQRLWPEFAFVVEIVPQVDVKLSRGYWLTKYELTQGQWEAVMGMGSRPWTGRLNARTGNNVPATWISWGEAMEFCDRLTEMERNAGRLQAHQKYTLPTEAQWEYACRAGTTTIFSFGDDRTLAKDYAWCYESARLAGEEFVHDVGMKKPNPWGLYDMHGNVSEWCLDKFSDTLPGGEDPVNCPKCVAGRVLRGGSWYRGAGNCSSTFRGHSSETVRGIKRGFRVALVEVEGRNGGLR